jgi:hypothetical protein
VFLAGILQVAMLPSFAEKMKKRKVITTKLLLMNDIEDRWLITAFLDHGELPEGRIKVKKSGKSRIVFCETLTSL